VNNGDSRYNKAIREGLTDARTKVRAVYDRCSPDAPRKPVVAYAVSEMTASERNACLYYGADRLFGEIERRRQPKTGLRRGSRATTSQGEQISLPPLHMNFPQAREMNAGEFVHAQGSLSEAEFDKKVIDIAEERCRERGLDPSDVLLRVGDFISEDEVAELREAL
jgi:hypothetical protein